MTSDDVVKGALGLVLTLLSGLVTWLMKTVMGNREELVLLKARVEQLEKVNTTAVSADQIRVAIDEALVKRDKAGLERRMEWERRFVLEIKNLLHEEMKPVLREIDKIRLTQNERKRHDQDKG